MSLLSREDVLERISEGASFAGVLCSSRDRVGRRYPFVLGSRVPAESTEGEFERLPISLAEFLAEVKVPQKGEFEAWKAKLMAELRRVTFRCLPERIPPAKLLEQTRPSQRVLDRIRSAPQRVRDDDRQRRS